MVVVAGDLLAPHARSPQLRTDFPQRHGRASADGKHGPQATHRDAFVLLSASPLTRVCFETRGCVREFNERLHTVAVLSARPTRPPAPELARLE